MSPSLLRTLWRIVEATPTQVLLSQNDYHLQEWLLTKVANQTVMTLQERQQLRQYLKPRLLLIRDLADSRPERIMEQPQTLAAVVA